MGNCLTAADIQSPHCFHMHDAFDCHVLASIRYVSHTSPSPSYPKLSHGTRRQGHLNDKWSDVPYSQRHPSILIYKHKASLRFANNDEPFQTFFKMECKKTHGSGRASNDSRPQKAACMHLQPSVVEGAKHSDGVRAGFYEAPSSGYIQPTRKLGLATKSLRKGHSSENILEPVPSSHSSLQHLL